MYEHDLRPPRKVRVDDSILKLTRENTTPEERKGLRQMIRDEEVHLIKIEYDSEEAKEHLVNLIEPELREDDQWGEYQILEEYKKPKKGKVKEKNVWETFRIARVHKNSRRP